MLKCSYLIIGSGETGITVARELIKTGESVFLAEQGEFGGSYLNSLEYPKAKLKSEARHFSSALSNFKHHPDTFGILRKQRQKLGKKIVQDAKRYRNYLLNKLEKTGNFRYLQGKADFFSKSLVEVNSAKERHLVGFDTCIIASGKSSMIAPSIKGMNKLPFLFRHNIFNFDAIPSNLALLSCSQETLEVASVFSSLGIKCTIYDSVPSSHSVPNIDRSGFNYIIKELSENQVDFIFDLEIKKIEKSGRSFVVTDSNREENKFSHLYVDVEEVFDQSDLNLDKIGLKSTPMGIANNGIGKTAIKNIWVFGEASSSSTELNKKSQIFSFTQSEIRKKTKAKFSLNDLGLVFGEIDVPDHKIEISSINCLHPVYCLGFTEQKAIKTFGTYIKSELIETDFSTEGFIKCIYKESNQQILGITLAGEFAQKYREYAILAIKKGSNLKAIKDFIRLEEGV